MRYQRTFGGAGRATGVNQHSGVVGPCLNHGECVVRLGQFGVEVKLGKRQRAHSCIFTCGLGDTLPLARRQRIFKWVGYCPAVFHRRAGFTGRLHVTQRRFVTYNGHRFTVGQTVFQRVRAKQHRQGHCHSAHLQHGNVGNSGFKSLRHDNRHPITRLDTARHQPVREPIGLLLQLCKGIRRKMRFC